MTVAPAAALLPAVVRRSSAAVTEALSGRRGGGACRASHSLEAGGYRAQKQAVAAFNGVAVLSLGLACPAMLAMHKIQML